MAKGFLPLPLKDKWFGVSLWNLGLNSYYLWVSVENQTKIIAFSHPLNYSLAKPAWLCYDQQICNFYFCPMKESGLSLEIQRLKTQPV